MSLSTRRTPLAALVPLATVLLATACASAVPAVGSGADRMTLQAVDARDATMLRTTSRSRLILGNEIAASRATSVEQAIRTLRPEMLRLRRSRSATGTTYMAPTVYLDEQRLGGADMLSTIPVDRVRMVRYLSEIEADVHYGGVHPAGAIVVKTW